MFAAQIAGFCARIGFLKDADYLLFAEAGFLHKETPYEPFGSGFSPYDWDTCAGQRHSLKHTLNRGINGVSTLESEALKTVKADSPA